MAPIRKTAVQENQKTEGLGFYAVMRLDGDADAETQQTHPTQPRELVDTWDCRSQGQRQENCELKATPGYVAKHCLKTNRAAQ